MRLRGNWVVALALALTSACVAEPRAGGVLPQARVSATPRPQASAPTALTALDAALAAARPTTVATPAVPPLAPPTPAPLPTPAAVATAAPLDTTNAAGIHTGGVVFANPFGIPARVGIGEVPPEAWTMARAGHGLMTVGNSGTLISELGGGVIGNNGGNMHLLAADEPAPGPQLSVLALAIGPYLSFNQPIDAVLQQLATNPPPLDQIVQADAPDQPGGKVSLRLSVAKDHASLACWRGAEGPAGPQIFGLGWTDPQHGRAVFRGTDGQGGRYAYVLHFDHTQGISIAEHVGEDPTNGNRVAGHLRVVAFGPERPFAMRAALTNLIPANDPALRYIAVSANFLPGNGGCAMWFGVGDRNTNNQVLFFPRDGKSFGQLPPAPHVYYQDGQGRDLAEPAAALQAITPTDELPDAYPADPSQGDPYADPRFAFP